MTGSVPDTLFGIREWCEQRREETDALRRLGNSDFYRGRDFAYAAIIHNCKATEGRLQRELAGEWRDSDPRIDQFQFIRAGE